MPKIHAIPETDLKALARYDTPTICNVVELFDHRPRTAGYLDRRIQACFPKLPPMVGYAATATFRSAAQAPAESVYASLDHQIRAFADMPGPPIVVFQDLDNPTASATFGEVMCTTYKTFGAVGLITSGAARDLDQVEALGFPCFADGVLSAHGYCHIPAVSVTVQVGGVTIRPGDLLHGDRNGVTTIPNHLASAVADACPQYMAAEAIVLDYLRSGAANVNDYADARRRCKEMIEALAGKLKARGTQVTQVVR